MSNSCKNSTPYYRFLRSYYRLHNADYFYRFGSSILMGAVYHEMNRCRPTPIGAILRELEED